MKKIFVMATVIAVLPMTVRAAGEKNLPKIIKGNDDAKMVLIPAGYFMMGSTDKIHLGAGYLRHKVYLKAFYIDVYPVTFDQYDKFIQATGGRKPKDNHWGRGKRPVCDINWNEANAYCRWAGKRLPTEAEWEKATRGGADTVYFWGDTPVGASEYVWSSSNSGSMTHPVGEKKPNPFGLFDILGNVWEWCSDWWRAYPNAQKKNPVGLEPAAYSKILRGGSWSNKLLTPADRLAIDPDTHSIFQGQESYNFGCRCAEDAP